MRLKEETEYEEEKREESMVVQKYSIGGGLPQPTKAVVVGYALTSKKKKSFLQPKLEGLARNKGILFVAIDPNRPLSEQGPFDIVLHKLSGKEWRQILEDYRKTHPEVTVLDPPDAIQHVYNRQFMLQDVADLNLSDAYGGVLFKVYIVGEAIKVVRRFSLPDVSKRELSTNAGVFRFPRVSCAAASADDADLDPGVAGYGKMPGYEHIFTDFLLGLVQSKHKKRVAKPVEEPV
ncbi:inositol 1,3,4-trisphosphate 5/6-kinase family protein [Actinidia rufa]|uniref:Inositol 1,3,4-trisphosphate 5/6-kinase family protein n=1 Tax=Actinidia rufa TaxID=165716 RepID=A0A7J0GH11_9ERIC|nr:inositol 1,3,4-trisphosphate 5/6-kinase family protein [Actinidia rufa]